MIRQAMEFADLTIWPQIGLITFMACFFGVGIWVWYNGRNHGYDHMASLPLEDDSLSHETKAAEVQQ